MPVDARVGIGGAAVAGAILVGAIVAFSTDEATIEKTVDGAYVKVGFADEKEPAEAECAYVTALATVGALRAVELDGGSAGSKYVRARICYQKTDGGQFSKSAARRAALPTGFEPVGDFEPADTKDGVTQLEAWVDSKSTDGGGFPCACKSAGADKAGASCEWFHLLEDGKMGWEPAIPAAVFHAGRWRGEGCIRHTCVVIDGDEISDQCAKEKG
jgi:hypothetical protein